MRWYRIVIGVVFCASGLYGVVTASNSGQAVGVAIGTGLSALLGFVFFAYGLPLFFRWLGNGGQGKA